MYFSASGIADFYRDKEVITVQQATEGNVDIRHPNHLAFALDQFIVYCTTGNLYHPD